MDQKTLIALLQEGVSRDAATQEAIQKALDDFRGSTETEREFDVLGEDQIVLRDTHGNLVRYYLDEGKAYLSKEEGGPGFHLNFRIWINDQQDYAWMYIEYCSLNEAGQRTGLSRVLIEAIHTERRVLANIPCSIHTLTQMSFFHSATEAVSTGFFQDSLKVESEVTPDYEGGEEAMRAALRPLLDALINQEERKRRNTLYVLDLYEIDREGPFNLLLNYFFNQGDPDLMAPTEELGEEGVVGKAADAA